LKHRLSLRLDGWQQGIARPHGRARIETLADLRAINPAMRIARPHGRARIETNNLIHHRDIVGASPGLTAGRGLKLWRRRPWAPEDPRHRPASRPGAD